MTLNNFLEGIKILLPHYSDLERFHLGAERDVVYLYETDRPLSTEDVERMIALGWLQEDAAGDTYDADPDGEGDERTRGADEYEPGSSWRAIL